LAKPTTTPKKTKEESPPLTAETAGAQPVTWSLLVALITPVVSAISAAGIWYVNDAITDVANSTEEARVALEQQNSSIQAVRSDLALISSRVESLSDRSREQGETLRSISESIVNLQNTLIGNRSGIPTP
jgi:hypothetical protein